MSAKDRQSYVSEEAIQAWLDERKARVVEAQRRGEEELGATFVGIFLHAGPGAAGGRDHDVYQRADGTHFVFYGPQENFVSDDDPEEKKEEVLRGTGKVFISVPRAAREAIGPYTIRTIDLKEVKTHTYGFEGLFTSTTAYLSGEDTSSSRTINRRTHSGTPKRAR